MRLTDTRDKTSSAITFNDVIESTGYIGKYQIIQSVFLLLSTFVVAFPILNIVFLGKYAFVFVLIGPYFLHLNIHSLH